METEKTKEETQQEQKAEEEMIRSLPSSAGTHIDNRMSF